jgi:hypothetical protein
MRQSWLKRNVWKVLIGLSLLGMVMLMGHIDREVEKADLEHYCEMVKLHKQSKAELGWPDYRGIYLESCR